MAASSPSSLKREGGYDVFLSFRGLDVRNNFLSHLSAALDQNRLSTYVDSELRKGQQISSAIMKAIEESHVAIVVFSENYACSTWCLDELTKIMECKELKDQVVLPIFYKIDPREVRTPRSTYRVAMSSHEMKFQTNLQKVERWKEGLSAAGNLNGWELNDGIPEAPVIKEIIEVIRELKMYDVFLSFRGSDVREDLVKGLNDALAQKGINAFVDSEKLLMGLDFPPALKHAIEQSRMYIIVFSENYAESRWCLKELVQILKWKKEKGRRMLPIFYQVEPREVRGQKQSYDKALTKHAINYGKFKVTKWREALTEAADVNGVHLPDGNIDGSIPNLVKEIEKMLAAIRRQQG